MCGAAGSTRLTAHLLQIDREEFVSALVGTDDPGIIDWMQEVLVNYYADKLGGEESDSSDDEKVEVDTEQIALMEQQARKHHQERLGMLFDDFDRDRSGSLSLMEFMAAIKRGPDCSVKRDVGIAVSLRTPPLSKKTIC